MNDIIIVVNEDINDLTNVLDDIMDIGVKITEVLNDINIVYGKADNKMMDELKFSTKIDLVKIDEKTTII